jgi:Ni/Co efflux regulator RcnB
MNIPNKSFLLRALAGLLLSALAGGALADKPSWAGGGKQKESKEQRVDDRPVAAVTIGFGSDDRRIVGDYYGAPARQGKCPPGLAKKNNGCLPPGQAKKWNKGQPLAKEVEYHELPKELRVKLPAPPPDHRYVRVAGDILMIAVGTRMVVDAIEDILR